MELDDKWFLVWRPGTAAHFRDEIRWCFWSKRNTWWQKPDGHHWMPIDDEIEALLKRTRAPRVDSAALVNPFIRNEGPYIALRLCIDEFLNQDSSSVDATLHKAVKARMAELASEATAALRAMERILSAHEWTVKTSDPESFRYFLPQLDRFAIWLDSTGLLSAKTGLSRLLISLEEAHQHFLPDGSGEARGILEAPFCVATRELLVGSYRYVAEPESGVSLRESCISSMVEHRRETPERCAA